MMKAWIVGTDGKAPVQVIWQTGKYYEREMQAFLAAHPAAHVWQGAFIDRMDYAYAAADLVVSRSGAGTVSELCLVAKPVLFVPSPNVAEDHQTKNARALETKGAAVVVPDAECQTKAMPRAVELLADRETLAAMSRNLEALALGAPVALANATCLPELYGDTARYFDPYDYDVDLDALAAQPVAAPDEVLKKYSWDKTAEFWLHEMEKYAKQ